MNPVFWEIEKEIKSNKLSPYLTIIHTHEDSTIEPLKKGAHYIKSITVGRSGTSNNCNLHISLNSYEMRLYMYMHYPPDDIKIKNTLPLFSQEDEEAMKTLFNECGFQNVKLEFSSNTDKYGYAMLQGTYKNKLQFDNLMKKMEVKGVLDDSDKLHPFADYIKKQQTITS